LMLGNLAASVQMKVIEQLRNKPRLIVLDTMNFWMNVAMDDLNNVLQKVDVLMVNDSEARELSGEFSLVRAARKILQMGPQYLIIKKREKSDMMFSDVNMYFVV